MYTAEDTTTCGGKEITREIRCRPTTGVEAPRQLSELTARRSGDLRQTQEARIECNVQLGCSTVFGVDGTVFGVPSENGTIGKAFRKRYHRKVLRKQYQMRGCFIDDFNYGYCFRNGLS